MWCIHVFLHSCVLLHSSILCFHVHLILVQSCIPVVYSCVLSRNSYGPLSHLLARGRVNICVVVISLITITTVFPIRGGVGGIIGVIVVSFLSLE